MDATGRTVSSGKPSNIRKTDRVFKLEIIDGKKPKTATGLVDQSLFKGTNTLHAKLDPQTCLWRMEYENGILPQPLKQRFTDFNRLFDFATNYFKNRNIKIAEVMD